MEPSYKEFQGKIQSALHNISELKEQNAEIRVLGSNEENNSWEVDTSTDVVLYLSVKMKNNEDANVIEIKPDSSGDTNTNQVIRKEVIQVSHK